MCNGGVLCADMKQELVQNDDQQDHNQGEFAESGYQKAKKAYVRPDAYEITLKGDELKLFRALAVASLSGVSLGSYDAGKVDIVVSPYRDPSSKTGDCDVTFQVTGARNAAHAGKCQSCAVACGGETMRFKHFDDVKVVLDANCRKPGKFWPTIKD